MSFEIAPLSPAIGAEIHGVDLGKPLDEKTRNALLNAWHDYLLLLFREQDISDDALIHSSDWIGSIGKRARPKDRRQEQDPYIMLVSNIRENGELVGSLPDGEMWFHHDMAFVATPHRATLLYAVEISQPDIDNLDGVKYARQPAIVRHPDTGKCALYINRLMSATLDGMDRTDAENLIDEIIPYAEDPAIIYEHHWCPGDYIVWDNRCSTNARTDFPADQRRLLRRGMIEGDPMIAAWA